MGRKGMAIAQGTFFAGLYNMGGMVAAIFFVGKVNGFFAGACFFYRNHRSMVVVQ